MAVSGGCRGNKKVEERRNGDWQTLYDFSFVNSYIGAYSMVNLNDELFLLAILNLLFILINNFLKAVITRYGNGKQPLRLNTTGQAGQTLVN